MFNGNMGDALQQVKKMQQQMEGLQQQAKQQQAVGDAGAGMVKVNIDGGYRCHNVAIDPSLLTEDIEVIEDLVAAAINDATARIEKKRQEVLSSVSGMLPPGFQLPL